MALIGSPATMRRFVLGALGLAGADFSTPDEELIIARCQVTRPGGIFTGPRVVQEELQMIFTAEGAAKHPSAELVCPGSYRLQWLIAGLRARGFLTRQFYAEDLSTRRLEKEILSLLPANAPTFDFRAQRRSFVPFLLAILRLTLVAGAKRDELLPVVLNLQDGTPRPRLPERLRRAAMVPDLSYQRLERRRLPWREVWRLLQDHALERLAAGGTEWYRDSLARLVAEGKQLAQYYQEMLRGATDEAMIREEYARRAEELAEKHSPAIRVGLVGLAVLYLPLVVYTIEGPHGRPLPPIRYEPAAQALAWEALPGGGHGPDLTIPRDTV